MATPESRGTTPYWATATIVPEFGRLTDDAEVDVVVVGGGITGLTTAYLLAEAGTRVIVLERGRCAAADTGHTSAHVTMVTDTRLGELVKAFGRSHAQAVWDAGLAAIGTIDRLVRQFEIDAGFAWVEGYLHAPRGDAAGGADQGAGDPGGAEPRRDAERRAGTRADAADEFRAEADLARELGFDVDFVASVPLVDRPGLRVADQVRIHPGKYLAGLATAFVSLGGRIHEHSPADDFSDQPRRVTANGHTVACTDVVLATHHPLVGLASPADASLFQTKLALYSSYVVAGRVARGVVPDALWWDTADPYHYLRVEPHGDHDVVILGGEDHKTGQEADTEGCYRRLEQQLRSLVPLVEVTHRWSGQVIETPDGLPYIGQSADHQYSATGYAGNGLTFGTLAGVMIADAILQRPNPWSALFDPERKVLARGLWDYMKENADYPYYKIRDRFAGVEARSLRGVRRGEGQLLDRDGATVAAYRDPEGVVTLRSAACTHMGCLVAWNAAEQTWDCPCHGSRFTPSGEVIGGPAQSPLPPVE
ncbi:MAG: FAD-dependent oxidoreductase [Acidobacteria bacterium]|nr:FAD-dependent oxidoreductase [Acidobacteriota bacterium]